jgi:hypothetical protein
VFSGGGIGERLAGSEQQILMLAQVDLAAGSAGATDGFARAFAADRALEVRAAKPALRDADRDGLPRRAGDRASVEIDLEITFAEAIGDHLALGHRSEHLHITLGRLGPDGPVAVGGVAQHAFGAFPGRLGVDEMLGLVPSVSAAAQTCTAVISGSLVLVAAAESL